MFLIFEAQRTEQISWALLCCFEVPLVRTFNNRRCLLQVSGTLQWLHRELRDKFQEKQNPVKWRKDEMDEEHCTRSGDRHALLLQKICFCDDGNTNQRAEKSFGLHLEIWKWIHVISSLWSITLCQIFPSERGGRAFEHPWEQIIENEAKSINVYWTLAFRIYLEQI